MFACFLSVWETWDKYSLWSYFDKAFSFTTLAGRQNQKPDENMFFKWYRKATRRKTAFHHTEKDPLSPSRVPQLSEPSSGPRSSVSLICSLRLQSLGTSCVALLAGPGSCQTQAYPRSLPESPELCRIHLCGSLRAPPPCHCLRRKLPDQPLILSLPQSSPYLPEVTLLYWFACIFTFFKNVHLLCLSSISVGTLP